MNTSTILDSIKIGRKVYKIYENDFVLFNGAYYQFCSGDGRILIQKGWDSYTNIRLPKCVLKRIPFDKMMGLKYNYYGIELTKWLF